MAHIKTEPLTDYYDVKEELGRGRFAVVKRCVKINTGEVFAAKCIRKARAGRRGRDQLLLEIDILHSSDHPKLVNLYDVFETRSEMILILEYAAGGDLHKHCIEVESVRTEKEICFLIYQIVEAASYLHDNHVVHLDLKPENILLKNDQKFPEIRLIDFGLSRRVDLPYSQYDIVGTPEYVAPEVLSYEAIQISADFWSIGVVSYVLLSGISPFAGDDVMETYSNIANVDFDFDAEEFDDISDEAKDFIESLLIKDPKERLTTKECLEHPWLSQMSGGVRVQDIEAAIIAEEAFEKLIREESISRLESEGDSVFSTQSEGDNAAFNDDSGDQTTDDAEDSDYKEDVFPEEINDLKEELTVESIESEQETLPVVQDSEPVLLVDEPVLPADVTEVENEVPRNNSGSALNGISLSAESNVDSSGENGETGNNEEICSTHDTKVPNLPEPPKASFGFDIDCLICKDDSDSSPGLSAKVEEIQKLPSEIELNGGRQSLEEMDRNGDNDRKGVSEDISCNADVDIEVKSETIVKESQLSNGKLEADKKESNLWEENHNEYSRTGHVKQRSSDACLSTRASMTSITTKAASSKQEVDGKIELMKAKSVDDTLLFGKRKTSDVSRGKKLGAHLEKLTKAGLNLVTDSKEAKRGPQPYGKRNGSTEKLFSADISAAKIDVTKKESAVKEPLQSLQSSGSSTPSSGRVSQDVFNTRLTPGNEQLARLVSNDVTASAKTDELKEVSTKMTKVCDGKSAPVPAAEFAKAQPATPSTMTTQTRQKDEKTTPLLARSKPSTPSDEKSAYPKKANLGVRQGIAAQMASKFNSPSEQAKTPPPSRVNKTPNQSLLSNRKYWATNSSDGKESENARAKNAQQSSQKIDKTFFTNAVKVAKGEASQQQTTELERTARSPRNSPKMGRSPNLTDMQVKGRAEQYMKAAAESDGKKRAQAEGLQNRMANRPDTDSPGLKKAGSKENILQKFEKHNKKDDGNVRNQVHVQPRGLQFNFNLQAGNKFKQKDSNVCASGGERKISQEGKKTVTFDTKNEATHRKRFEIVTVPKSFSGMLDQGSTMADQGNGLADDGNDHIEHTAIGAIATMPRTPLRDLRSRSRTSRDGSPLSPRKAYRRLYVTHVKGSKSEQEADTSDDIAEFKTKVEKDELKVELLVKFGTL